MTETIHVRRAGPLDTGPMADLLNEVIAAGGTTALSQPVTGDTLKGWMDKYPGCIWHMAEDDTGTLLGFQYIHDHDTHGPEVATIATFARRGRTGLGIGSRLFEATRQAAADHGYTWIEADIRADNAGGLAYYQSRGFERYGTRPGMEIAPGLTVDKVLTRYDL